MMRTSFLLLLGTLVLLSACSSNPVAHAPDSTPRNPTYKVPERDAPVEITLPSEFQGPLFVVEWKKHKTYDGTMVEGWDYFNSAESGPLSGGDSFNLPPTAWLRYFPEGSDRDEDLETLARLPALAEANFGMMYHFDIEGIARVGRSVGAMDWVTVIMPPGPPDNAFVAFARRPYLSRLHFSEHTDWPISSDALRLLDLPHVERLELKCRAVDEEVLKLILLHSPKLKVLDLSNSTVSPETANRLAEQHGVHLSYGDN